MGTLTVNTGWKKGSSGPDAVIDYYLELKAVGSVDFPKFHSTDSFWSMAISKDTTV